MLRKHTTAVIQVTSSVGRGEGGGEEGADVYLLDVAYPVPDVVKGLLVGDVVYQHDALRCRQEVTSSAQEVTQVLV